MKNIKRLNIAFVCDAFNSMAQRLYLECTKAGHTVTVYIVRSSNDIETYLLSSKSDLVICPFLTKRIPESIYNRRDVPCLIVHPGIEGDRGMSSIDWALIDGFLEWGVTILQAVEDFDAGPIWATNTFPINTISRKFPSKSGLYRSKCIDAAVKGIEEAIEKFSAGLSPRKLDYTNSVVKGRLRPPVKIADRYINWSTRSDKVCQHIQALGSQPGAIGEIKGELYLLFNAVMEDEDSFLLEKTADCNILLGKRNGAILVSCGDSTGVWISHLKKMNTKTEKFIKLPAIQVLPRELVDNLAELAIPKLFYASGVWPKTFQEVFCWRVDSVVMLWFDFYNGAMSTDQCNRLAKVLEKLEADATIQVLLLMGGELFFSNGINLNTIEASEDPYNESWLNINAIDDVVKQILLSTKIIISCIQGNAGAGGAMMALSADYVWTHEAVVLNPSYKGMNLFGSEYWTYTLPKRVGQDEAKRLTTNEHPISADQAKNIGLVDEILCADADEFARIALEKALDLSKKELFADELSKKASRKCDVLEQEIEGYRERELDQMKLSFGSGEYARRRHAFAYKYQLYACNS